jgi:hypothetical protein
MSPYQTLGCWALIGSCFTAVSGVFVSPMASCWALGTAGALAVVGFMMRVMGQGHRAHLVAVTLTIFATIFGGILFRHDGLLRAVLVGLTCYVNALVGASAQILFGAWRATRVRDRPRAP